MRYAFTAVLGAFAHLGMALVLYKPVMMVGYSGPDFLIPFVSLPYQGAFDALIVCNLFACLLYLCISLWSLRIWFTQSNRDINLRSCFVFVSVALFAFYVGTFSVYYATDQSFTRTGGTTAYCYKHSILGFYEPLADLADTIGLEGGKRYADGW